MNRDSLAADEFVQTRVLPELQPIAPQGGRALARIGESIKACAPNVQEVINYGIPACRVKQIVAMVCPTKKDISFSFSRGTAFEDIYGLLRGVGKVPRHVKIKNFAAANRGALRDYI